MKIHFLPRKSKFVFLNNCIEPILSASIYRHQPEVKSSHGGVSARCSEARRKSRASQNPPLNRTSELPYHKSLSNAQRTYACALNAERNCLPLSSQLPIEDRLRYEYGREDIGQQADHQRHRKAFHGAGPEQKEEGAGNHGGDVGVDDGDQRLAETRLHGGNGGLARAQLFADALEDQNVGIHGHTYGEDYAGDTRQRQNRAEIA